MARSERVRCHSLDPLPDAADDSDNLRPGVGQVRDPPEQVEIGLSGDCNQAVAARDFAAVRADIESDNDHTDTPTTMSIDGFFFLIRHPGPRLMARSAPNRSGSGAGSSSVKLYSEKFGAAPSRNSSHFSLVFTVRNSRSSMVPRITG